MTKEYFSHDYGTRNKKLMAVLLHEHKCRGYGLFWVIVEMLHEGSCKWMELDELTYISIEKESGEPAEYIKGFIDQCINRYKVFQKEGISFTTERVLRNIDTRLAISQERSESGKKGAEARWQKIAPAINSHDGKMANDGKGKERKVKESKKYLRPKGLTASFEADPAVLRELKKEYDALADSLDGKDKTESWTAVKGFVIEKKPAFIEPFIDLWNIFALTHYLIKNPIRVTEHRRKKFETRIREPGFDFIQVLQAIKKSSFLKGGNDREWTVDFEFIIHSEENYTNIIEGKYK